MYQEPGNRHRRDVDLLTLGSLLGVTEDSDHEGSDANLGIIKWGELIRADTQSHRFKPVGKEITYRYWYNPGFFELNQFIDEVNQLPLFKEMNTELLADIPHALGYFQRNMFKNASDSLMQQIWAKVEENWFVWSAERFKLNAEPQDLCEASMGLQTLRASAPEQKEIPEEWRDTMAGLFSEMLPGNMSQQRRHSTTNKHTKSAHLPDRIRPVDAKNVNVRRHMHNLEHTPKKYRHKMTTGQFFGIMEAWSQTPGMMTESIRTDAFIYLMDELMKFGSPDGKPEFTSRELTRAIGIAAALDYATPEFMRLWEIAAEAELGTFTPDERVRCVESLKKLGKAAFPEFENAYWESIVENSAKLDDATLTKIVESKEFDIPAQMMAEYAVRKLISGEEKDFSSLTEETFKSLATRLPELDHAGLSRALVMATESGNASRDFLKKWEAAAEKHLTQFTPEEHLTNMSCFRAENTKASAGLRRAYWKSAAQNVRAFDHEDMMDVLRTAAEQGSPVPESSFEPYANQMIFELPAMSSGEAIRVLWDLAALSVTTELPREALSLAHDLMPLAEKDKKPGEELQRMRYEAFQRFFPIEVKTHSWLAESEEKFPVSDAAKSFFDGLCLAEEEMGIYVAVENEETHTFRIKGRPVRIEIDNTSNVVPDTSGNPTTYTGKTLLQSVLRTSENPDEVVVRLDKALAAQIATDDGQASKRFESFKREVVKLYPGAYTATFDGKRFDLEPMEFQAVPAWTPRGFQRASESPNMG